MKRLLLIRHALSQANAGLGTNDPAAISLVEEGRLQAQAFADAWSEESVPDRVVVSPYLRTQQTAEALLRKLALQAETWPEVREFTYLDLRGRVTTPQQRRAPVEAYWAAADPTRCEPGAESFEHFWRRTSAFATRTCQGPAFQMVFTHGLFMAAFDHQCTFRDAPIDAGLMRRFDQLRRTPVPNCMAVEYRWGEGGWTRHSPAPDGD